MRRRILIAIVGVAAGGVFLLALPLGIAVQRLYQDDEVLKLERNATAQARDFDPSAAANDPVEFQDSGDGGDQIAAYSLKGVLLGGEGPAQADALVQETLATGRVADSRSGTELTVSVPVLGGERVVGAIRASRATSELDDRVLRVRLVIAAAALLIIGLAAIAALTLSRRLSKPLAELADSARAAGERGRRAPAPRSGINELDIVAEALDAMVARLDSLLAREREFSANASHQLRTPLAALRLDLESRALEGEEVDQALAQIDRLERTIATLLAAARDDADEPEPLPISELLDDLQRRWVGVFAEAGRSLDVDAAGRGGARALASRAVVEEIVEVLLDNAIRHGRGRVRVRSRPIAGQLAIDVSDEGPGVNNTTAAFERGTGTNNGIGLALARALAEGEGGRLDLTDARPGETTFTVLLRAAPAG